MPDTAARAFTWACALDVGARKPGNVSWASPGHGMAAQQFIASARVAAPALTRSGEAVGARIEAAMRATLAEAGCNTNLGIVLLAAPLLAAHEIAREAGPASLADALAAVLAALDVADAQAAFRAIAATRPAGLGAAAEADVHAPAQVSLLEAMRLAAHRDRIARQYAQSFAEVFALGVPAFLAGWRAAQAWAAATPALALRHAMLCSYLAWLASAPDSHIARKHGDSAAHTVTAQAQPWAVRAAAGEPLDTDPALAAWDEALKRRGLNPGSSADLAVASALVAALREPAWLALSDPGAARA